MNLEQLKTYLKSEEDKAFKGWDFSYLNGRWSNEELPWDYKRIISDYLKPTDRLLDMGTGGGEFLLTLNHPYELTSVTEAYPPNVQLCMDTLMPLGIEVKQVFDDNPLPFEKETFDVIINRHEDFDTAEVKRILKQGGYFITQQVGGRNNNDLSYKMIDNFTPSFPGHDLAHNSSIIKAAGFHILFAEEAFVPVKFFDLGALVYFAKIIEWEFPGFSVESCFGKLCRLQKGLQENGYIAGTEHRFVIVAQKI